MNGLLKFTVRAMLIVGFWGAAGCATIDGVRKASVGEGSVQYAYSASLSPTIVFEAGLGDGMETWRSVLDQLPGHVSTFAYSRAGYGGLAIGGGYASDRDGKRTGVEVAMHLRALLEEAGAKPPYVLVGHSIGGPYVLNFALSYPDEVAGIILVDGRPPAFTDVCKAADAGMCEPPAVMTALMPPHQRAEVRGLRETYIPLRREGAFAGVPMTVIAATEPDLVSSDRFQRLWLQEQRAFAKANGARYVEATGSSHYIHKRTPSLVVDEIETLIESLKDRMQ